MTAKTPAPSESERVARAVSRAIDSRIIVYGPSGSGTTTVSRRIGRPHQRKTKEALAEDPAQRPDHRAALSARGRGAASGAGGGLGSRVADTGVRLPERVARVRLDRLCNATMLDETCHVRAA